MLWNDSLKTGIPHIDEKNETLFKHIGALLEADNSYSVREMLNIIETCIVEHFSEEQRLHAELEYPKAGPHKWCHDSYVVSFRRLKASCLKDGKTLANTLAINRNVVEWLKKHIMVHDMDFAGYYKATDREAV